MNTTSIIAPRTVWQYLLSLVERPSPFLAEKIASVAIGERDYNTEAFFQFRAKLMRGILVGLDEEKLAALAGASTNESEVELELTVGELTYLDMSLDMTAAQWAVKFKHGLWEAITSLLEKENQE